MSDGKYECTICGYVYDPEKGDPENGIAPGTPFTELPETWICPVCGCEIQMMEEIKPDQSCEPLVTLD